jgi:hypothetical protein
MQHTSYADHVSVVSPGEFHSAVACVSVELTVYNPWVSTPASIAGPNPQNSAFVHTLYSHLCVLYDPLSMRLLTF